MSLTCPSCGSITVHKRSSSRSSLSSNVGSDRRSRKTRGRNKVRRGKGRRSTTIASSSTASRSAKGRGGHAKGRRGRQRKEKRGSRMGSRYKVQSDDSSSSDNESLNMRKIQSRRGKGRRGGKRSGVSFRRSQRIGTKSDSPKRKSRNGKVLRNGKGFRSRKSTPYNIKSDNDSGSDNESLSLSKTRSRRGKRRRGGKRGGDRSRRRSIGGGIKSQMNVKSRPSPEGKQDLVSISVSSLQKFLEEVESQYKLQQQRQHGGKSVGRSSKKSRSRKGSKKGKSRSSKSSKHNKNRSDNSKSSKSKSSSLADPGKSEMSKLTNKENTNMEPKNEHAKTEPMSLSLHDTVIKHPVSKIQDCSKNFDNISSGAVVVVAPSPFVGTSLAHTQSKKTPPISIQYTGGNFITSASSLSPPPPTQSPILSSTVNDSGSTRPPFQLPSQSSQQTLPLPQPPTHPANLSNEIGKSVP